MIDLFFALLVASSVILGLVYAVAIWKDVRRGGKDEESVNPYEGYGDDFNLGEKPEKK